MDPNPLVPSGADVAFGVAVVIATAVVVGAILIGIVVATRDATGLSRSAREPDPSLPARGRASRERTPEARLAEVFDLHRRGLITGDELGELRRRILGEL